MGQKPLLAGPGLRVPTSRSGFDYQLLYLHRFSGTTHFSGALQGSDLAEFFHRIFQPRSLGNVPGQYP